MSWQKRLSICASVAWLLLVIVVARAKSDALQTIILSGVITPLFFWIVWWLIAGGGAPLLQGGALRMGRPAAAPATPAKGAKPLGERLLLWCFGIAMLALLALWIDPDSPAYIKAAAYSAGAAAAGGLVGWFMQQLFKLDSKRPESTWLVTCCMVLGGIYARSHLETPAPTHDLYTILRNASAEYPVYGTLLSKYPAVVQRVKQRAAIPDGRIDNASIERFFSFFETALVTLVRQQRPYASEESLVQQYLFTLSVMDYFKQSNQFDLCHRAAKGGNYDVRQLPPEFRRAQQQVLVSLLESSIPPANRGLSIPEAQRIVTKLLSAFGKQNPAAQRILLHDLNGEALDPTAACSASIAFMKYVLGATSTQNQYMRALATPGD